MPPQIANSIPALDLRAQYASIREEIQAAIQAVLDSQIFILGPQVQALEQELAAYCGTQYAIGVASGTDALLLALHACGVRAGHEVIVPAFTYIATADVVSLLGATPVFADIEPATFTLDPSKLEPLLTKRTRAIIPVHLYGQTADMDPLLEFARHHGLQVVEDAAQAIGATYRGKRAGSIGELGCLSFYPTKNLGGYGDGGMIVSNSPELHDRLRSLRSHGETRKYVSAEQGWNSRLDEIQAAVLRVKLRHLNDWNSSRRRHASEYTRRLGKISGVVPPKVAEWGEHVFHQYTVRVPRRDEVQRALANEGVPSTVYYPVPLHLQGIYRSLGYKSGSLPEAERASAECLSLPIYPEMSGDQITRVVEAVEHAVGA
ncbi:MAG TPA: DegT/DnrJ/EryC1/StrS family aminotransferase [Terriglobales bacterium]|nr:DegT/DnrJ/EryC1/StrS family aminotransferase [Terriglobales bacterium]